MVTGQYANRQYELRLGTNFNSPTFTTSISNVFIHPSYDGTRNTPDLAVIQFTTPYEGISQVNFGTAVSGELIAAAGFGFAMRPEDPIPTSQDGFVRGWNSRVDGIVPPVASSDLYYNASLYLSAGSLGGKLLGGDSGSVSLNSAGQIIGLNTAQTGGISAGGSSIYLDLTPGSVWVNWILEKTALLAAVPDLSITPATTGPAMRLTWDAAAIGYRLQTSETGSGWAYLGPVITAPGTLDDPIADRPRRYYRLAKP